MTPLLEVNNLVKYFPVHDGAVFRKQVGAVKAVDDVTFAVRKGETLALVGESGCGKSTTGRLILRLLDPTSGSVRFEGKELSILPKREMREMRRRLQIVFQDPFASLNPRMTVGEILEEPLKVHGDGDGAERKRRVEELLSLVGLSAWHAVRYPHEFSGGQRQRIGVARALALRPSLVVCDEPVSALDVSIQAQVVNLLRDLQARFNLAYVFIAHDLAVVKHMADRIAVMYLGKIVEIADKKTLFENPRHPYTRALFSAIPMPDPGVERHRVMLDGDVPSPMNPPSGCRFHTRCPYAQDRCRTEEPGLRQPAAGPALAGPSPRPGAQLVACHYAEILPAFGSFIDRKLGHAHVRVQAKLAAYEQAMKVKRE